MPQCAFKSCVNNHRNAKADVHFFRFPSNRFACAKWASIVAKERGVDVYKPFRNSTICSIHFDKLEITGNTQRLRLRRTAIPKLQLQKPPVNTKSVNCNQASPSVLTFKNDTGIRVQDSLDASEDLKTTALSGEDSVQGVSFNIWDAFEKHPDSATCKLCRESLPRDAVLLKNHLAIHKLNRDDDNYTNGDGQNCYSEIVYLQDEDQNSGRIEPKVETTEEPEPTRKRRSSEAEDSEEIDNFGKYVTSLLKKLPKDLCMKLQMDIVNLIMTAKLNRAGGCVAPSLTAVTVGSPSYLVTVPNHPAVNACQIIRPPNPSIAASRMGSSVSPTDFIG